jgi:hypothetical protein
VSWEEQPWGEGCEVWGKGRCSNASNMGLIPIA